MQYEGHPANGPCPPPQTLRLWPQGDSKISAHSDSCGPGRAFSSYVTVVATTMSDSEMSFAAEADSAPLTVRQGCPELLEAPTDTEAPATRLPFVPYAEPDGNASPPSERPSFGIGPWALPLARPQVRSQPHPARALWWPGYWPARPPSGRRPCPEEVPAPP